jgi:carbonic anhydrase/acetyltransferase-like protein (isoleucine patch superfamily)
MRPIVWRSRLMRPYNAHRFGAFGAGSIVHKPTWVYNAHLMAIGAHVLVLTGASLSVEGSPERDGPVLSIGDRVGIRPAVTISASEGVTIEDDVIIGSFSSIVDSDHTFDLGRPNVMHNPSRTAPIQIGRGTWLAERVAVLKGVTIGRCCMVGANSVVREDLPDYSIAVGVPARVVGKVAGVDADAPPITAALW